MEVLADHGFVLIALAVLFGLYLCWGIGANDVANAMGTSVGSGAISVKQAIVIAAVFEFAGAFLAGGEVTRTLRQGIIDPSGVADSPEILVLGMLGALLGCAVWLMLASFKGWPVSTTHSIVGAVVGFGMAGLGVDAVRWGQFGGIVVSWLVSPLLGGILAYLLMMSIRRLILDQPDPMARARFWAPVHLFVAGFTVCLFTVFKGLGHLHLDLSEGMSLLVSLLFGGTVALTGRAMILRLPVEKVQDGGYYYAGVERIFTPLMVLTGCAMAFAHGSNDVANGIGPMAAVIDLVKTGVISRDAPLSPWVLGLGGLGIVVGLSTYGYKVMQTIGSRITELTPTRGYSATLAAALTVVLASKVGLPVSTTHIAVGAVMGVGLARGLGALDLRVVGGIVVSWVITLPMAALFSVLVYFFLKEIFI